MVVSFPRKPTNAGEGITLNSMFSNNSLRFLFFEPFIHQKEIYFLCQLPLQKIPTNPSHHFLIWLPRTKAITAGLLHTYKWTFWYKWSHRCGKLLFFFFANDLAELFIPAFKIVSQNQFAHYHLMFFLLGGIMQSKLF